MPGLDDETGEPLSVRDDDRPDTVQARLETYARETAPVLDFYRERDLLVSVDASTSAQAHSEMLAEFRRRGWVADMPDLI